MTANRSTLTQACTACGSRRSVLLATSLSEATGTSSSAPADRPGGEEWGARCTAPPLATSAGPGPGAYCPAMTTFAEVMPSGSRVEGRVSVSVRLPADETVTVSVTLVPPMVTTMA